jgi:hypothetical protein
MQIGCKTLTPIQRKTMQLIGAALGLAGSFTISFHQIPVHHFLPATYFVIALIGSLPIIMTMVVIARYLVRETDEYLRSLVVRSLLWGFGITLISVTVLGYMFSFTSIEPIHLRIFGVLTLEMFVILSALALRIQLWRNR